MKLRIVVATGAMPLQAHLAEQNGCVGLIIYSDPADYAPSGGPPVFPNGTSLPPSGVQRGTLLRSNGDPLTPGVPAIPGVYRRSYEEVVEEGSAPSIPVQPVSYEDAVHFMRCGTIILTTLILSGVCVYCRQLSEYPAPANWTGQLNISYHLLQSDNNTKYEDHTLSLRATVCMCVSVSVHCTQCHIS